jgi:hypothetical protein
MTISSLLKNANYKEVFNHLYKTYYRDKKYHHERLMDIDASYHMVFEKLKAAKKQENNDLSNYKLYIANIPDSDLKDIDICLYDEENDELFALDFLNWYQLLDLEIYKTLKMKDFEILAHFLWEITFWGFSMEDVNKQAEITRNAENESLPFIDTQIFTKNS